MKKSPNFQTSFPGLEKVSNVKMKSIKAGEKLAFLKKTALIGLKKKTNQKSFKAGVLISLNALSHYFFSFFKGSDRRLCKTPLYRRTV